MNATFKTVMLWMSLLVVVFLAWHFAQFQKRETPMKFSEFMAQVELACGDYRIVSLMSRDAADELGLEVGKPATAVVKATNVIVEVNQP